MSRGIFLVQNDNQLVELREAAYATEDILQELLARYPALLAGDQIDREQPRRWLLISQEMSVPSEEESSGRWSVDHLFIDQDGIPTIVEVKRSSDTRIRREVVGQMLEYAANGVLYWPVESLRARHEGTCAAKGIDPTEDLAAFLGPDANGEAFWRQVKTNLQAGKIRLVFVADEISSELRRIIEFMNEQMDPAEVLGVEVRQYVGSNFQTLVPSVVGQTEEALQRKNSGTGSPMKQWDEESFLTEFRKINSSQELGVAAELLQWSKSHATRIYWGKGSKFGSFIPVFREGGSDHQLFAVYTNGRVEVHFQYLKSRPTFASVEKRVELQKRLNSIGGIQISDEALSLRPSIKTAIFVNPDNLAQLISILDWIVQEIRGISME